MKPELACAERVITATGIACRPSSYTLGATGHVAFERLASDHFPHRRRVLGCGDDNGLPSCRSVLGKSGEVIRQVDAGLLNVGYAELGPADGPPVLLLHGWPYDIHSFAEVTPLLAAAGYRVIVPFLRGYGTTRFLSDETARNG